MGPISYSPSLGQAINWVDSYDHSKERICFTCNELHIPGLRLFASLKPRKALSPLIPHYHENAFEFTFVSKGSMSFFTSGKKYIAEHSHVFISYPNEIHSTNEIPLSQMEIYWIQIDISNPSQFFFLNETYAKALIRQLLSMDHHLVEINSKDVGYLIRKAFSLCEKNKNVDVVSQYIIILLQMIIDHSDATKCPLPEKSGIAPALSYIESHLAETISLDFLAEICCMSTSYFKQAFRNIVGTSPRNFINQKKIDHSKTLLSCGLSVTDTAMRLGFNSSSYFSSVFKKYTALTPSQYIFKKYR